MSLSKTEIFDEYRESKSKYDKLGEILCSELKIVFEEAEIDFHDISHRTKEFKSFWDKIERKGYSNPFEEVEDICGIRIICFFPSQIPIVSNQIESNLQILEVEDKSQSLDPNQFGYLSKHYIVRIKRDWLHLPSLTDLRNLKAEIQVRTILMHAWADVGHKLAYKSKDHIPPKFMRKLNQLMALFEIADEMFDTLRDEREKYIQEVHSDIEKIKVEQLNLDSLQAILDYYFPDRLKDLNSTSELLDEIFNLGISTEVIIGAYHQVKDFIQDLVTDFDKNSTDGPLEQVGLMRAIMEISIDDYYNSETRRLIRSINDKNNELWKELIKNGRNK